MFYRLIHKNKKTFFENNENFNKKQFKLFIALICRQLNWKVENVKITKSLKYQDLET